MVAVFFDLQQAFDNIYHEQMLLRLVKVGIKGRMLKWIKEFLQGRKYQIIVENEKSDQKDLKRGVPQGSNLSPILFNLMMADIPHTQQMY